MDSGDDPIELKLTVILDYLRETISRCRVIDGAATPGERLLLVTFGKSGRRTVRVSAALLAKPRLHAAQLREALHAHDIARKVLATPGFSLDATAITIKRRSSMPGFTSQMPAGT